MAVAINTMFETTDDGVVVRENGQLKFKEGFGNTAEGLFNLYKEYHYMGKSATRVVDGKEVLTGNAFKSNKFIVFDEETGQAHNFGQDIIDTLFMLYAGQAQGVTAQHIAFKKDSEGKVEDLTRRAEVYLFSEEFDNLVNSKIDDFIKAYSKEAIKRLSKNKDIITAAKLASYTSVKGCIATEPNGYAIWEKMQEILDKKFKELGHVNVQMPLPIGLQ